MVMVFIGGFTFDIFGRRITILLSLILSSICCFFTPFTSPKIYPWLLLVKIFYTMCIMPVFTNLPVNDYIAPDSRGKGIAMVHLGMHTGHLFSSGVLYKYTNSLNPKISFMIAAIWGAASAIILMFFFVEPNNSDLIKASIRIKESHTETLKNESVKTKLTFIFKLFWKTARSNPAIIICLIAAMMARMHTNVN